MKIQSEVHFYDRVKISVSLDVPTEKRREFYEGLLFTLYVFRNWYSLGDHEVAQGLVTLLGSAGNDIESFIDYYQKAAIKIDAYTGQKAEKGFAAILNYDDEADAPIHFDLNPWGFGWLGTGLGYYSPISVGALLQYLLERPANNVFEEVRKRMNRRFYETLCYMISGTLIAAPPPTMFNRLALGIASGAYEDVFEDKRSHTAMP